MPSQVVVKVKYRENLLYHLELPRGTNNEEKVTVLWFCIALKTEAKRFGFSWDDSPLLQQKKAVHPEQPITISD